MSVDSFLDSNIFIYLFDETNSGKKEKAEAIVYDSLKSGNACISYQVVQEVMNVLIRKLGLDSEETHNFLNNILVPLWSINPSADFYRYALEIRSRYKYSFYDSLIITAAKESGCQKLLSEDLQHGHDIDGLQIENPFL